MALDALIDEKRLARLAAWFGAQKPGARDIVCHFLGAPKTGMSNDTRFVHIQWTARGKLQEQQYVLRCGLETFPIHPLQTDAVTSSVELQHRVMQALCADGSIPIAAVEALELDSEWLGGPFFLMEHVAGETLPDFPSFTESGPVTLASAGARRSFVQNGLAVLARLHCIDWRKAGLSWLDRGEGDKPRLPAQLTLWREYCASIFAQGSFPVLAEALRWLGEKLPGEPAPTLVWGDARPQNILWGKGFAVSSVMDWEGAAILPPEADIAYWLINDYMVHERVGVARLDGYPTRAAQLAIYESLLGRSVRDIKYYEIFGMMTIVATMHNVYRILREKGVRNLSDSEPTDNYFSRELARQLDTSQAISMEDG